MKDDRTKSKQDNPHLSDNGIGDDLLNFLGDSKPPRTRNLRPTFRPVPGDTTGFPGTRAFAPRRPDSRAAGPDIQPESLWAGFPPKAPASPDNAKGRRPALQQTGGSANAHGPALPAAEGPGGGNVRRRGRPPGSGKKAAEAALPKAIQELVPKSDEPKSSPKMIPTETERADARRLFREIGETFNINRKKSKTAAYAAFRHDLMANLDTLIMGGAIDLKEATTIITNLEQYTKETEAESTETPATILGKWLRMDAAEVAGLVPVEEAVEDEENSGEEDEENQDGQQSI